MIPTTAQLPADYHMHSQFSDGDDEAEKLLARAAALGLAQAGLADHLVPAALDGGWGVPHDRLLEYLERSRTLAEAAPLPVLLGLEVDYTRQALDEVRDLVAGCRLDYIIGSVHWVAGGDLFDAEWSENAGAASLEDAWVEYYGLVRELAASGMCDVIGHFDLVKRAGRAPARSRAVVRAARAALGEVARRGIAIEVNTAGWHEPVGEQYPSLPLLAYARTLRIPLTFASDAHAAREVARDFERAIRVAKAAGYTSWLRLSDREQVRL